MKNLSNILLEKLKINKDTKVEDKLYEDVTVRILNLCEIFSGSVHNTIEWIKENQDNIYFKAIDEWARLNDVTEDNLKCYCDKKQFWNFSRMVSNEYYFDEPVDSMKGIAEDIIENGKETLGKSWNDPKIYTKGKVLVFHQYNSKYGNFDRLFVKK